MINHPKLPGRHARDGHIGNDVGTAFCKTNRAVGELRLVPNLEANPLTINELQGWIHRLQVAQRDDIGVLRHGVVALRHIYNIIRDVFLHHEPRSTAETETLALPDGVEPKTLVTTQLLARFHLHDVARHLANVFADIVVVVDFSLEANPLTVMAFRTG